jgi:hypothetical protein
MAPNSVKWASAMLLCMVVPALADTRIATKYVADGQTTESVMFARGERIRYNYGKGESLLRQCDLKRIVQVDDNAKTFVSLPAEPATPDAPKPEAQISTLDTGERKEMFGYSARHVKITQTTAGSKERTETDGWYIELKDLPSCSGVAVGKPENPGYPAAYTITSFGENGRPSSTISMQITELTAAPLDAALFEIPAEYKDAGKTPDSSPAIAKASGTTRVGTVPMRNKSAHQNASTAPYGHLLSQLQAAQIDVLPLAEGTDDAIKAKAVQAQCDYILYTDLVSVQKAVAGGKVGGLIHKTPIVGKATDGDAYEARVDYRLVPVTDGAVALESSAVAKKGRTFNWIGAAQLASNFIPMTMAAKMLGGPGGLNPAMLNQLLKGGGTGNAMTSMDPMMGGMSMFLRGMNLGGAANNVPPNPAGMDAAMAAALDQQSKALLAHLKK